MIKNQLPGIYPGKISLTRTHGHTKLTGPSNPSLTILLKPGSIIEGFILKAQGSIYLIDTGKGEILAKSERPLEPGSHIKLQVLDDGTPASVRLIQEMPSSPPLRAMRDFLALRSSLSNLSRLAQAQVEASATSPMTNPVTTDAPHGASALIRTFIQGSNPEPEKLRLLLGLISFDPLSKSTASPLEQILQMALKPVPAADTPEQGNTRAKILAQEHMEGPLGRAQVSNVMEKDLFQGNTAIKQTFQEGTPIEDKPSSRMSPVLPRTTDPGATITSPQTDMPDSQWIKVARGPGEKHSSISMDRKVLQKHHGPVPAKPGKGSVLQKTTGPIVRSTTENIPRASGSDAAITGSARSLASHEGAGQEPIIIRQDIERTLERPPSTPRSSQAEDPSPEDRPIQAQETQTDKMPRQVPDTQEDKDTISCLPGERNRGECVPQKAGTRILDGISTKESTQGQDGPIDLHPADKRIEGHQERHMPSWIRPLVDHLESVHNLQHLYQKELDLTLILVPFLFKNGQGTGHWVAWKEENEGQEGERPSGYHLAFDLDLNNLGPVRIHILLRSKRLDIYMGAAPEGLMVLRPGFSELKQSLHRLGYQVQLTEVFTIEGAGQPILPGLHLPDVSNPKGSCHFVT